MARRWDAKIVSYFYVNPLTQQIDHILAIDYVQMNLFIAVFQAAEDAPRNTADRVQFIGHYHGAIPIQALMVSLGPAGAHQPREYGLNVCRIIGFP